VQLTASFSLAASPSPPGRSWAHARQSWPARRRGASG